MTLASTELSVASYVSIIASIVARIGNTRARKHVMERYLRYLTRLVMPEFAKEDGEVERSIYIYIYIYIYIEESPMAHKLWILFAVAASF